MNQATRTLLAIGTFLAAVTLAHGFLNLGWLEARGRQRLTVGHLPVT